MKGSFDRYLKRNVRGTRSLRTQQDFCTVAAVFVFLWLQTDSGVAQEAASGLLTTNSPFVLYLKNPPWIKEMRYVESRFSTIGGDQGKVIATFWAYHTNLGGIQPSGFSIQELPSPNQYTPQSKVISGVLDRYFWTAETNDQTGCSLTLSPRKPEEGGSEKNATQIVGEELKEKLERLRHLGLPYLLTNSFKLTGHDQFEAQTEDGYELDGKILTAVDDRPLILTYILGGSTDDVFSVKYTYKAGNNLPNYFECREFRHGNPYSDPHTGWLYPVTNWLEDVNYGLDKNITNGYTPTMFYSNLAAFRITVWSNGMRYSIDQRGRPTAVTVFAGLPGAGHKSFSPILLISLLVAGFFIWRFRSTSKD